MKIKTLSVLIFTIFLFVQVSIGQEKRTGPLPAAVFPEPVYEFPIVVEGLKVKHDFIVLNKGIGELKIQKVRTG